MFNSIFTIARPPVGSATAALQPKTFGNYAVPLLAILSRCLYLIYVVKPTRSGREPIVTAVPYMSCVMYFSTIALVGQPVLFDYLLGSTYTTGVTYGDDMVLNQAKRLSKPCYILSIYIQFFFLDRVGMGAR